jgi:hemoglobin/transferrin/lactoferrin receptor protein
LALVVPLFALALATVPDLDAPSRLDDVVVTAGRRGERASEVASAVSRVDAAALQREPPATVAELLRGQVGVTVQQTTPGQANVILRGLKGSEVLHLVDGVRLNNAFFRNAPNQYLGLVDAQFIERVEVVRGPLSTLHGGDAMGGVLQLFTPEPRFAGTHWQSSGQLRTSWASADQARAVHARHALGRDVIGLSASVSTLEAGNRRVGGGERLPHTGWRSEAASLRLLAEPADGHDWRLGFDLGRQPRTPRHDALVPGFGQSLPESELFLFEPNQRRALHLRHRWRGYGRWWDAVEWQLSRQAVDDDRRSRDFGSPIEISEQNRSVQDSLSWQAHRDFERGHTLLYGIEWLDDTVRSARQRFDTAAGLPLVGGASRFPDRSRMRSAAGFVQHAGPITARTRVSGGLRVGRHQVTLPPADRGIGVDLGFSDVSGSLGVVHARSDALSLVANLGRGFRPPNIFDLGTLGPRPGNRFQLPNAELGPERLLGLDAGLRLAHGGWQGELFAFRSDYRDKITTVLTGERDAAGRELVQSRNATALRLHGIEAGLGYRGGDWRFAASLTATRGSERFDAVATPADRIPPLAGRIALDWRLAPRVEAGVGLRLADRQDRLSQRDVLDPRIDPAGTPGYAVFDTRLEWTPRAGLVVSARLDNLADRRHREHGSGLDQPGRNLVLGLRWQY